MTEPNEVRVVRKHMSDWCANEPSLSGQTKVRLLSFVDAVTTNAFELAAPYLKDNDSGQLEPVNHALVERYAELQAAVDEILPRLIEYRKTWKPKLDEVMNEAHQAKEKAYHIQGNLDGSFEVSVESLPVISDEQIAKAKQDQIRILELEASIEPKLLTLLDKAEMTLTALRNVSPPIQKPEAELTKKEVPLSPNLQAAQGLADTLAANVKRQRDKL